MNKFYKRTLQQEQANKDDVHFSKLHKVATDLPTSVDLRSKITSPVIDQGLLNSCTACALSVAAEIHFKNQGIPFPKQTELSNIASAMFIYYNARNAEGTVGVDAPTAIGDGVKSLAGKGVCSETLWPYPETHLPADFAHLVESGNLTAINNDIQKALNDSHDVIEKAVSAKPSTQAVQQAAGYKIDRSAKLSIDNGLDEVKHCLAKGIPFVFGIDEPEKFYITPASGMMVMPPDDEPRIGGHALLAVGYDDDKEVFIVRNSYGKKFGDNGYCYRPYEFVTGSYTQNGKTTTNTFSFWCLLPD